ncbi:hypothetical protein TRIP_B40335 [uncultured Desulfatiglans sp.]|nr:hypothetical protein TRIP_B40335 [uncultured Desulfatiglans sp.]
MMLQLESAVCHDLHFLFTPHRMLFKQTNQRHLFDSITFHPEMTFLTNLGVNLHVCLCGDHQVVSAQTLDFLDIGQTGTRREAVGLSGEALKKNP